MGELSAPQRNARRTGDFRPFGATRTGWGRGRKINQARAAGCQVPIVRPERSRVAPVRGVLNDSCPNLRQWSDRVGFVVREGRGSFRLLPLPGTRVGPFRDSGADFGTSEPRLPSDLLLPATADSYPLAGPVGTAGRGLVASENRADLFSELLAALPPSERLTGIRSSESESHTELSEWVAAGSGAIHTAPAPAHPQIRRGGFGRPIPAGPRPLDVHRTRDSRRMPRTPRSVHRFSDRERQCRPGLFGWPG